MFVIADDLTGANDTAIQYKKNGISSIVCTRVPEKIENKSQFDSLPFDSVSINTDSRSMNCDEAYKTVFEFCKSVNRASDCVVYKKIDSLLRGNPGIELQAVKDAFKVDCSFICPSYPENDRIVENGILKSSSNEDLDVLAVMSQGLKGKCVNVPLKIVRSSADFNRMDFSGADLNGLDLICSFVKNEYQNGAKNFIFDAVTEADLFNIAAVSRKCELKNILCGSAGLAKHDAAILGKTFASASADVKIKKNDGLILVLTGSRNIETRSQVELLSKSKNSFEIILDTERLESDFESVKDGCLFNAKQLNSSAVLIVAFSSLFENFKMVLKDSRENYDKAFNLSRSLGKIALSLFKEIPVKAIISCGGDTTLQLCSELNASGIVPFDEVCPGTPFGVISGGIADGIPIVTKSGGFGDENVLVKSVEYLVEKLSK